MAFERSCRAVSLMRLTLLTVVFGLFIHDACALSFEVEPYRRECFGYIVEKADDLVGSYEIDPPTNSFDVYIRSDTADNPVDVLRHTRQDEGQFRLQAPHEHDGKAKYVLCFQSNTQEPSVVNFHTRTSSHLAEQYATTDHTSLLDHTVRKIEARIEELEHQQEYTTFREERHRTITEKTNSKVLWWTMAQLGLIAVVSVFQVYYVRTMFEVKTIV